MKIIIIHPFHKMLPNKVGKFKTCLKGKNNKKKERKEESIVKSAVETIPLGETG